MQTWEWVIIGVVLVGALVFTLAWWKIADFWADAEHKRFKGKGSGGPSERVVIKHPGSGEPTRTKDGGERGT